MILGTVSFYVSAEQLDYDLSSSHSSKIVVELCTTYYDECVWDPQAKPVGLMMSGSLIGREEHF
jgi:hypothetical protein